MDAPLLRLWMSSEEMNGLCILDFVLGSGSCLEMVKGARPGMGLGEVPWVTPVWRRHLGRSWVGDERVKEEVWEAMSQPRDGEFEPKMHLKW